MWSRSLQAKQCNRDARACPNRPRGLWTDRRATSSVQYAVIASLIALVVIPGVTAVGEALQSTFTIIPQALASVVEQAPARRQTCTYAIHDTAGGRVGEIRNSCKHARTGGS